MNYLKNYDRKEYKFVVDGLDGFKEFPEIWNDSESVKMLDSEEYPIPKDFKKI